MKSSREDGDNQPRAERILCLPEGFDLGDAPTHIWRHRREIKVFVSRIVTMARTRDEDRGIPIRWEEGVSTFGRRQWKTTRDWLEANHHIECDHEAQEGVKAFWYNLGERWRSKPIRHEKVDDPASLAAWMAIRGNDPGGAGTSGPVDPVRAHLNRWLRAFRFDPNVIARGMDAIDGSNARKRKGKTTEEAIAEERRDYAQMIIELSQDPDERDGEYCHYGRFHSILTRMPRWMREAIRIDDEPMIEVDIRATQPLIQAIIATHGGAPPTPPDPAPDHPPDGTHHTDTIHCRFCNHSCSHDLSEFFRDYPTVDFYRWVAPKFGMPCETEDERDAVKRAWAWLVFDKPRWNIPEWRSRWEEYRRACPSVAGWLVKAKEKDYREAARTCQRFESRLMIQGVCGRLMVDHPDLPILTIHDAILTRPDGVGVVCDAIRDTWATVGAEPALKIKPCG